MTYPLKFRQQVLTIREKEGLTIAEVAARFASVVILDNATFHKRPDIPALIRNAGHSLEFLPPYSPDLNPIEHKWFEAKAQRKRSRCSVDRLFSSSF